MNRNKSLIIVILAFGLWWLVNRPAVYQIGERRAATAAKPFWAAGAAASQWFDGLIGFFSSRRALEQEIAILRQETARLRLVALERERLMFDNQALREILNHVETERTVTVGRVLTRPTQSPFGTIIVDLGQETTNIPIKLTDLAAASGTVAIGEIIAVSSRTAKIRLYSAWGESREVLVGLERAPAVAEGRGHGNFSLSLPRDLPIDVGDQIIIKVGDREYLLGLVNMVNRDPVNSFQEILFRSPVNLDLLRWVEIYAP